MTASITHLRGLAIETPHFDESVAFYSEYVGLTPTRIDADNVGFQGRGQEARLLDVHRGPAVRFRGVTVGMKSKEDIDALAKALGKKPAASALGYGFTVKDPDGNDVDIRTGEGDGSEPPPSQDGFPINLSHVVINSTDPIRLRDFYVDVLGFRIADMYENDLLTFLRADQPQHHCIGIGAAPKDGLNHFSFECGSLDGVMKAVGRMKKNGHEPIWGPGRHGPGGNVFCYYADPNGLVPEFTSEVIQIHDDANWQVKVWPRVADTANVWGTGGPTEQAIALMSGSGQS